MLPVKDHGTGPYDRFVRANHGRLVLPLGPVDRDSGVFRTERGIHRDLRNVLLRNGTIHLRQGMLESILFSDNAYAIIGMEYLPYSEELIVVTASAVGDVDVWSVAGLGATPTPIGTWFTYNPVTDPRPVVTLAESYNKIFMAHDEAVLANREPTFCYDPDAGVGAGLTLGPLTAPWAPGSLTPDADNVKIRFRSVVAYLDYLIGTGFGNNEVDRPELIRTSLPGEPLKANGEAGFDEMHYAVVGSRGEPVITCAPAGRGLVIFKQHETYPLLGTSPQTFGVGPAIDHHHGIAGVNLWTNLNGVLFFWSEEGPRASTGGPSEDLAIPLDLDGPSPDALADGIYRTGFATYVPEKRAILFSFGRWVYALDVRDGKPAGWSYWEVAPTLASAAIWREPQTGEGAEPVAGPKYDSRLTAGDGPTTLLLRVQNPPTTPPDTDFPDANTGNEWIQGWYRVRGTTGGWTLGPVKKAGQPGTYTDLLFTGLLPDTEYELAFRYRLNNQYNDLYPTGAQDVWPADSKTIQKTLAQEALGAIWRRTGNTTEEVALSWQRSQFEPEATVRVIEKHVGLEPVADPNDIPDIDWTQITTVTNAMPPEYAYTVLAGEEEEYVYFRVRLSTQSGAGQAQLVWTGPRMPYTTQTIPPSPTNDFVVSTSDNPAEWSGRPHLWISTNQSQGDPYLGTPGDYSFYAEVHSVLDERGDDWASQDRGEDNVTHQVEIELEKLTPGTNTVVATLTSGGSVDIIRNPDTSPAYFRGHRYVAAFGWVGGAQWTPTGWQLYDDIEPGYDYRARVRVVSVFPATPTGTVLDYSPWSSYSPRFALGAL